MNTQEIQIIVREEINSSPRILNIEKDVSRIGILQEELNSKMDFVLDALQPVIEKIQSVRKIESDLVRHDEDIDVTKNALKSHITDNSRHV